jgi:hypothetical protein
MTQEKVNILLFKTNIQTILDKQRIQASFDSNEQIYQWNIDLQDVDCVLRIVSETLTTAEIISAVELMGFDCTELE